jgi:hypothetical protein
MPHHTCLGPVSIPLSAKEMNLPQLQQEAFRNMLKGKRALSRRNVR